MSVATNRKICYCMDRVHFHPQPVTVQYWRQETPKKGNGKLYVTAPTNS